MQIKKTKLEKKIVELNKDSGNEVITSLLQEKDMDIQALKKKLNMTHDAHVQTTKLETILQEKKILENELQNTKATIGTFKTQNQELEQQIQSLKI